MLEFIWLYYTNAFYITFAITNICLIIYLLNKISHSFFSHVQQGSGKYALVTGCDTGFGYLAAHELNKRGTESFIQIRPKVTEYLISDINFGQLIISNSFSSIP